MNLTPAQIAHYHQDGYLLLESCFSLPEVTHMLHEMEQVIAEDCPRRILEKNGAIRSFFAPDFTSNLFRQVTRLARLVTPARQLLGEEVYIHQTKLNSKHAMVGDWWEWHQDYTFWQQDDGMPRPQVLTAMIFLNDITEFNGPMLLIPGSQAAGVVDATENISASVDADWFTEYQQSTSYMSALTADLKYTLKQQTIAYWASRNGMQAAKGPAGSVLFFHGNVFHASANNLSPWDRHTFLITYNSVDNALQTLENPRPEFIANRDFTPIVPLFNEMLVG
jgi:ectoine hydroxylase